MEHLLNLRATVGVSLASIVGYLAWKNARSSRSRLPYPPGPKPLPLIENLLDIPTDEEWLTYRRLSKEHGDIVHLEALGQHIIIISSEEIARELLVERSLIYSSRPVGTMSSTLMGLGNSNFGVRVYGEEWRKERKMFHQHMHINAVTKFKGPQTRQTRRLLKTIATAPEALFLNLRGFVGASIIDTVYGVEVSGMDDRYITVAEEVMQMINASVLPGAFMVDLFPPLQHLPTWFPGASFHHFARRFRVLLDEMLSAPLEQVEMSIISGEAKQSMVSELLEEAREEKLAPEHREVIKQVAGAAYEAGSDTGVSTLYSFFLAMTLHPEVQAKAQAELDAYLGQDRLPEFADEEYLPYVRALVMELQRWIPVTPMLFPHATSEDDEYGGYYIPKGSAVTVNLWSIFHNPEVYPEPEIFRPSRFLGVSPAPDPREIAFGFGRRTCAGQHFAEQLSFIAVASVLSVFSITPRLDENGVPQNPKVEMARGLITQPKPFQCIIKPRSAMALQLIEQPLPERGL